MHLGKNERKVIHFQYYYTPKHTITQNEKPYLNERFSLVDNALLNI